MTVDRDALHAAINPDRVIDRTAELVRIPSANPFERHRLGPIEGEAGVAAWLSDRLDALGCAVEVTEVADQRPNVVATRSGGGDGPTLLLAGHTDTVGVEHYEGDPFSGTVADGRVHGRGACDMKGALAAFVEVAEVLHSGGTVLGGSLVVAGIADEEAAMLGSKAFPERPSDHAMAIVGEPTELRICPAHLGQYAVPIRTEGVAVHSSIAADGVNAIEHMMAVIAALGRYRDDVSARAGHAMCGPGSVNVGVIDGGTMVSIVPDTCEIHLDRRVSPGETFEQVRAELSDVLDAVRRDIDGLRVELGEPIVDALPLDTPVDAVVVGAAQRATAGHGLNPNLTSFPAATDAPNLGLPAVIWGPGSLDQAHTVNEWVETDQLVLAAHLYLDAVLEVLQ